MNIKEIKSNLPVTQPTKEVMSAFIDGTNPNLPNRNVFIYCIVGSPGSGKSSMLLSMFNKKNGSSHYRGKFDNIILFTPESSFLSVKKHPFTISMHNNTSII